MNIKNICLVLLLFLPLSLNASHDYKLGIYLEDTQAGLLVTEIGPGGNGEKSGLLVGDIVLSLGGMDASTYIAFANAFPQVKKSGHLIELVVIRNNQTLTLVIDARTTEELTSDRTDKVLEISSIQEAIGTYEGKVTWDGGESPVTTAIFKQGDSVGGTTTYPDGAQYPITFIKALPEKRGLLFGWKENDNSGQALFLFSTDYSSFEGTWGYDQALEGDGIWTGRVREETKAEEQAQQDTTTTVTEQDGSVPFRIYNTKASLSEDEYDYRIPVGHLSNSQEICSVLQHSVFQRAIEAQTQFEQQFYFLERGPLLTVLKKTIETEWKFPNVLFNYSNTVTGEQLRQWMVKSFEEEYGLRNIERMGGSSLMAIQDVNKSNMRMWKESAQGPPSDSIFLENAWAGCLRTIQQTDPALFSLLFQRNILEGWISSHCLEAKGKMETVFQADGTITEKMVYEPTERGCAQPRYGGILNSADGLLFLLVSHREGHKWLLPMLSHFQKNLEQQIIAAGGKIEEEKKQQEEAQALAKAQAEEAEKPENQLANGYISYLRTKACYEARQGYAVVYITDTEMDIAKRQIKSIENAINSQHEVDLDMIWEWSINNMSPLGGLEMIAGGLKEYLAMEAQSDFDGTRNFCQFWKMPLTHLENKWVSGASGSGEVKKDF